MISNMFVKATLPHGACVKDLWENNPKKKEEITWIMIFFLIFKIGIYCVQL